MSTGCWQVISKCGFDCVKRPPRAAALKCGLKRSKIKGTCVCVVRRDGEKIGFDLEVAGDVCGFSSV